MRVLILAISEPAQSMISSRSLDTASPVWVRVSFFPAEVVEKNGDGDKTRNTIRTRTAPMWGGPVTALASSRHPTRPCLGKIHALHRPPRESHTPCSSWCRPLALFHPTSRSVATPSFRNPTTSTTTSPRCGQRWRPFLRGILNCVGIRGWSRIYGLRKLSAV